jgi:hypothetical protein
MTQASSSKPWTAGHKIKVTTFTGSLRMVECSCGWAVGCHSDRKALRLIDEHHDANRAALLLARGGGE